ncbi:MAG: alpha-amylase family glycosyl hydrolase [Cyclobacteriaceae bacterium]
MKRALNCCLLALLMITCQPQPKRVAQWPHGVNYEVFVRAFADGNADGIGDLKGLTSKLDYLQELGVGGVWLMPIMKSPTYHKYDVVDYTSIDPEYGTVEDFNVFVTEAHKRGIRVLVDLILNHTGADHPWFQSARNDPAGPYRDYYIWANRDSVADQITKKETQLDSDNITQWHSPDGSTETEHYYGYFSPSMPDLNFDNSKVREEFVDIGRFWLQEMDVDGFRLDAAKHIYPTDRATDNHAFWVWFRTEMQKLKKEVYLVGEVYTEDAPEEVAPYLKGLPALFNFELGISIIRTVNAGFDTLGLVDKYKSIVDLYTQASGGDYIDATFIRNHDQNRTLSELGGNLDMARVAAAIQLTFPGTPYIYYGEEIGMLGQKPDEFIREPFLWDDAGKSAAETKWEVPKYSTDQTVRPVSRQKGDPNSLYEFYRELIALRSASPVLTYGTIEQPPLVIREVVGYVREYEGEWLLVMNNVSDVEVTFTLPPDFSKVIYDSRKKAVQRGREIRLPAFGTIIAQ